MPLWGVVVLYIGVGQGGMYNLLPRQHHCKKEIWATFLDVTWVTGYINTFSIAIFG